MGSLFVYPKFHAQTAVGTPLNGGKLYTYVPGTTTPKATYVDANFGTANANPVVLDSNGDAVIYFNGYYDIVLKTSLDVEVWSLSGVNGISATVSANEYYADPSAADQGATTNAQSAMSLCTAIGATKQATIKFAHSGSGNTTTYTVGQNTDFNAVCPLAVFEFEPGAVISHGAFTVHIPNRTMGGAVFQWIEDPTTGTGMVTLSGNIGSIYPDEFLRNTVTGVTDMTKAIQAAFNAGNSWEFRPVVYKTTAKVTFGSASVSEGKYKCTMPPGSLISATVAGDYAVKGINAGYSNLEFRIMQNSATGHGLGIVQDSGNSLSNRISGYFEGIASTIKPAITTGTRGITFEGPVIGYANYYNHVLPGTFIVTWDIGIDWRYFANANNAEGVTFHTCWTGFQISSSQNGIGPSFFENMKGDAVNGTSHAIHLGNGSAAVSMNNIRTNGEPGPTVYQKFIVGESNATNNIIIVGNNSEVVFVSTTDIPRQNHIIDAKNSVASLYDLIIQNDLSVFSSMILRNTNEFPNGGFIRTITAYQKLTFTATATVDTTSISVPAGALLLAASFNNEVAMSVTYNAAFITGATNNLTPAGAVAVNKDTKTNTMVTPTVTTATTQIRFTATAGSFTTGDKVRIVVYYMYLNKLLDS